MSTSRKRYRPLDSGEERAVTVHECLQLLPLEDEQSYCFSWPEAPLTQWLQSNVPYASLYQLYPSAGGVAGGGGVSSLTTRGQSSGFGDAGVASLAVDFSKGTSKLATLSSSGRRDALGLSSPTGMTSLAALQHQRSIEIPPVFLLDDSESAAAKHARASNADRGGKSEITAPYGSGDVQSLLQRVRDAVEAVRHDSTGLPLVVKEGASPSKVLSPSIVVQSDAVARAVPHPLAPPRPQSITEDSTFSLSATQLADLVTAGVPELYASADRDDRSGPSQRVEDSHTSIATSAEGSPSGKPGVASNATKHACNRHDRQPDSELSEVARREIEHEVVGLEWRTWSQSQRTAAALQRILSLEAAVPFESSGDARRDAWRGAVYRLWLQWRQQRRSPMPESAADDGPDASITRATNISFGFSGTSTVPSATSLHGFASFASPSPTTAALAFSKGALAQARNQTRLPWGAPLLAGAYLYGTSNDYFISLPPSTTSAIGQVGKGGGCSGNNGGGLSLSSAATTSWWPAVSRRRGTYSFLRWNVELYEAQLSRTVLAVGDDEDNDEDSDEMVDRDKSKGVEDHERRGNDSAASAKARRFSKGPFGGTLPDAPASQRRSRRSGDGDRDMSATATSHFAERKAAPAAVTSSSGHTAINGVMSVSHMKALLHTTVLTQPLTELQMDDEPTTVMERLACSDLRRETDAWRVWLSRV